MLYVEVVMDNEIEWDGEAIVSAILAACDEDDGGWDSNYVRESHTILEEMRDDY